jgi:hypothetical protein
MRTIKILLAMTLLLTAVAIAVPQEGKAGPPGKVEQTVKAVDQSYDFQVVNFQHYDACEVIITPNIEVVKNEGVSFTSTEVPALSSQRFRWCNGNMFVTPPYIDYHTKTVLPNSMHAIPPLLSKRE